MNDFFDAFRWVNISLSIWVAIRLGEHRIRRWRSYSSREQVYWNALMGICSLGFVGSLENILQNGDPGSRVVLTGITLVFILWGTYLRETPK